MLFYLKKHFALELLVSVLLGGLGLFLTSSLHVPLVYAPSLEVLGKGFAGASGVTAWTFLVQEGYARVKGRAYADELAFALAKHFDNASVLQIACAFVAAAGEELFFRGFLQGYFGLVVASFAFMLAHIGGRDIRIIGYWSVFHGIGFGLVYVWSGNILSPLIAHGLFDLGAMVHFRILMRKQRACAS